MKGRVWLVVLSSTVLAAEPPDLQEEWSVTRAGLGQVYGIATGAAKDGSGNLYVAGYAAMGGQEDALLAKYDSAGILLWVRAYDGSADERAAGVAIDGSGHPWVVGYRISGAEEDVLLLHYDPAGSLVAELPYDGGARERGHAVAVDGSGRILVAGYTAAGPEEDVLLLEYSDSTGFSATTYGDSGIPERGNGIAVDASGTKWVAGRSGNGVLLLEVDAEGSWTVHGDPENPIPGEAYGVAVSEAGVYLSGVAPSWIDTGVLLVRYAAGQLTVFQHNAGGDESGMAVAVDETTVHVAGYVDMSFGGEWGDAALYVKFSLEGEVIEAKTYDGSAAYADRFCAVVPDGSGGAYLAGRSKLDLYNQDSFLVRRYPASGADQTVAAASYESGDAAAVDAGGNVIVAGPVWIGSGFDIQVLKLTPAGSPHPGFGDGGIAVYDGGNDEFATGVAAAPDGSIYVSGYDDIWGISGSALVLKFTPAGVLDESFGAGGVQIFEDEAYGLTTAGGIAIDPSGNVFVAGVADGEEGEGVLLLKYDASGTLVWSRYYAVGTEGSGGSAIARDAGGYLFITGYGSGDVIVLKCDAEGNLSPDFGEGGIATFDGGGDDSGSALVLDDAGGVWVTGATGTGALLVLRFDAAGNPQDPWIYDGPGYDMGLAIAIDSERRLWVAGEVGTDFLEATGDRVLVRFAPDGSPDPSFGQGGISKQDSGLGRDSGRAIAVASGVVVVAGLEARCRLSVTKYSRAPRQTQDQAGSPCFASVRGAHLWAILLGILVLSLGVRRPGS